MCIYLDTVEKLQKQTKNHIVMHMIKIWYKVKEHYEEPRCHTTVGHEAISFLLQEEPMLHLNYGNLKGLKWSKTFIKQAQTQLCPLRS